MKSRVNGIEAIKIYRKNIDLFKLCNKLKKCKTFFTLIVDSESMLPALGRGQVVQIRPMALVENIEIGDIIVFQKFSSHLTIHRVIWKEKKDLYKTKGDNNEIEDAYLVEKEEIIGVVSY